jgi:hypothetical protein
MNQKIMPPVWTSRIPTKFYIRNHYQYKSIISSAFEILVVVVVVEVVEEEEEEEEDAIT